MDFPSITKSNIKVIRIWNRFIEWLKMKELCTVYDFKVKVESRLKVSKCKQFYKYKEKDRQIRVYQREGINWSDIEKEMVILVEWICCMDRIFKYNN